MLLNDIRIVDLSQYIPGPYMTRGFADLGAEVIKIEPPAGDPMRFFSADSGDKISDVYRALNLGKKIVRLNLKTPGDLSILKNLLIRADVLIDGFRPGTLDKLGLTREVIKEINAKIIHCTLTGYGQTGPCAQKAGHDLGYCAAAGMLGTFDKEKTPTIFYPPLADHVGALQASNTILAALFSRTKSGEGVFIDASLYEPMLAWQYLAQSRHINQVLGGEAAYYNVYKTSDSKFITLSALEEKFWKNFCHCIERSHWIDRHKDLLPQEKLKAELTQLFISRTQAVWNKMLTDVDCCYEPVPDIEKTAEHPQSMSRNMFNHYPNKVNNKSLRSTDKLIEIKELERIDWD